MNYGPLEFAEYLARNTRESQGDAVCVYEAVAMRAPRGPRARRLVKVVLRPTIRPVVLVLSSYQAVHWEIAVAEGARLRAVLLSGYGESTVGGAGDVLVTSIGGFYAFEPGTAEFKHLESEVMRCTGRHVDTFQSEYVGQTFEIESDGDRSLTRIRRG
jgi:hypothetical protein